jgi:hypothetical protein
MNYSLIQNGFLLQRNGDFYDCKIADFGLSALCRIGENGYHGSKSSKRKEFQGLTEVRFCDYSNESSVHRPSY